MGRVVHFEIHADRPERAATFYAKVFGWKVEKWGEMPYWLVTTGKDGPGIDGGIVPRRGPAPSDGQPVNAYVCTVAITDCDAAVRDAIAAGATPAVPKMAIPGVGWLAYVKDTEGNILGLMQDDPKAK